MQLTLRGYTYRMRPVIAIAAAAVLVASPSAQQSAYSSIENVADFMSHLDISADSQAHISAILGPPNVHINDSMQLNLNERSNLACLVAGIVFGSSLYTQASANYEDLVDDNWSVLCLQPSLHAIVFLLFIDIYQNDD